MLFDRTPTFHPVLWYEVIKERTVVTVTSPPPSTAASTECGSVCQGLEEGEVAGGCCEDHFCYCRGSGYHVECPQHQLYCPLLQDCVHDITCSSHQDQCC